MVDVVQLPLTFTVEEGVRSSWTDWTEKFDGNLEKLTTALRERQEEFPTIEATNGQVRAPSFVLRVLCILFFIAKLGHAHVGQKYSRFY